MARACELICQPSARSAIELNHQPAQISTTIMAAVTHITIRVPRSALSLPLSKTWLCVQGLKSWVCIWDVDRTGCGWRDSKGPGATTFADARLTRSKKENPAG